MVKRCVVWPQPIPLLAGPLIIACMIACGGETEDAARRNASNASGGIQSRPTTGGNTGTQATGGRATQATSAGSGGVLGTVGSSTTGGSSLSGLGGSGGVNTGGAGGLGGTSGSVLSSDGNTGGLGGSSLGGSSSSAAAGSNPGSGGVSTGGASSGGVTATGGSSLNALGGAAAGHSSTTGGTTSATCPVGMSLVSAGDFLMGSDASERLARADEMPRHQLTLSAYCLDTFEVTNAEYEACVDAGSCSAPKAVDPPSGYGDSTHAKRPVVGLSWEQASDYCAWAKKRLPTEAEWEKAARGPAPDTRLSPWGDVTSPNPSTIYFCPQESNVDLPTYDVSPYGIVNMVSAAPEWVADWYDSTYYAVSPRADPQGPATGTQHVVRSAPCATCTVTLPPARVAYRQTCGERAIDAIGVRCAVSP